MMPLWMPRAMYLHDAVFSASDIGYDEGQGVFRLSLWREVRELARSRRVFLLGTRVEMPVVRAQLEIGRVLDVQSAGETKFESYQLNTVEYEHEARMLRLRALPPLTISIRVEVLLGSTRDVGDPTWEGPHAPAVFYR